VKHYFLGQILLFNRNPFSFPVFKPKQQTSYLFSLSPLKYNCKAATLLSNTEVLSDTGICARIWDFQREKKEEKEMGKFLMA